MATGVTNFPASLDTTATLLNQVNVCSSLLSASVTDSDTSLTLTDASSFPTAGIARLEDEYLKWTGKSTNTLTGLSRGAYSSVAVAHSAAAELRMTVMSGYHNVLVDAMIAVETKFGTGADTPAANEVLRGTGSGTSDWGQIANAHIATGAAIDAAKIADGSISNTEFQYLNGASSNIQTQLDSLSGGSSGTFIDTTAVVKGSADATKQLRFEVDGFTTATTRVLTPPNYDGTIATLAGTETLSNKTLASALNSGYQDFTEIAAPSTPASGTVRLYAKSDGLLYSKDDAGTETVVTGGGGGSAAWSAITDPSGNLSLAMGSNLTTLTWAGNYSTSSAFKLAGNNTSATGPLVEFSSAGSNNMSVLILKPRGGRSFEADKLGSLLLGKDSPGNTDTDGYVYLGTIGSNLFPSGTPTTNTGFAPITLQSNGTAGDYSIWGYMGSAWRDLGGQHKRYDTGSGNGAQTIDFNSSTSANVTRVFTLSGGNATFTFSNPPKIGSLITLVLVQDGSGLRTVTFPASVKWPAGVAPTLTTTANKRDIFVFFWDNTNYWNVSQNLNL